MAWTDAQKAEWDKARKKKLLEDPFNKAMADASAEFNKIYPESEMLAAWRNSPRYNGTDKYDEEWAKGYYSRLAHGEQAEKDVRRGALQAGVKEGYIDPSLLSADPNKPPPPVSFFDSNLKDLLLQKVLKSRGAGSRGSSFLSGVSGTIANASLLGGSMPPPPRRRRDMDR